MRILGIVLAVLGWASAASAVVLSPGDILTADERYGAILHVDPSTGVRTVVSGCFSQPECQNDLGLASPVGSGPSFRFEDGMDVFKVDPATGDRTALGGLPNEVCHGIALVPEPTGISVAVLPAWGGWLLAGVLLGLGIKGVRRGAAAG